MGAVAITNKVQAVTVDGKRAVEANVALSSSYATGGDTVSLATLGLAHVERIEILTQDDGAIITPNVSTDTAPKLKSIGASNTEATAATDQSAVAGRVRFVGR